MAGELFYSKYHIKYTTPTVGILFYAEDYISFVESFEDCINSKLEFKDWSKYPKRIDTKPYPIGVLGNDIEIHFLHYKSKAEAFKKWTSRCKRINFDNLFFIFSNQLGFKREHLDRYLKLPYKNKIFLSSLPFDFPEVILIKDFYGKPEIGDLVANRVLGKYLDDIAWLNKESNFKL